MCICVHVCTCIHTARNHFSDQRFLIAAVPKGLLLMQWYQPQHAFKHVMVSKLHCAMHEISKS